ncbi:iron ABC transporter permease [Mycetocola lacteus]|uniref:Iron ABC transporter permease n=1 Tax=Mycetocola lacteus TaxID=76637 RepID=A0A3L7AUD2_9MICO|nr:iron ABC transporter permease [Mycetocola lacteus]RLP83986.1 iron ABC transporter permease [Mycetocola lacteus]
MSGAQAPTRTRVSKHRLTGRRLTLIGGLAIALVLAIFISLGLGQFPIAPHEVWNLIIAKFGVSVPPAAPGAEAALWTVRMPRLLLGVLVGAALAGSGLLLQAIFGNPLADAGVIGISSGAALGAALAIVTGMAALGNWTVPALAFVGGLISVFAVYMVSRSGGKTEVVTLILTGIAINAICAAGLGFLTFLGNTSSREQIVFWQLGSLNGALWTQVATVFPVVVIGLIVAYLVAPKLDLFALGEKSARHLGVNVEALRITVILLVAVLVSVAVAFTGIIGFVGLVIPHLMRMIIGPAHRPLLLASVLGGALLVVLADLFARTAIANADLPIGMVTSLVGGPFFFWLLIRTRKSQGGWA